MSSSVHLSPTSARTNRPSFFRSISSSSSVTTASSFQKDKPRLYLALYSKGGSAPGSNYNANVTCDSYHWTFVVGPKTAARTDPGTCYQLLHSHDGAAPISFYDETELSNQSPSQSQKLLVRVALAKVRDAQKVQSLLRALSSSSTSSSCSNSVTSFSSGSDHESPLTCLAWLRIAFRTLLSDPSRPLKSFIGPDDWSNVEERTRKYVKKKRVQGRFNSSVDDVDADLRPWNDEEIPTWNFWENRETTG